MRKRNKRVLCLNADFTPLAVINWKRAIVLSFVNKDNRSQGLEVIDSYDNSVLTCGNKRIPIPAVVRVPTYVRQDKRKLAFSRKHIFLRDQLCCCYCGIQDLTGAILTYDHVIPRVLWKQKKYNGTPTNWNNIVTCCQKCNRRKRNLTLKECGMKLLREPKEPSPNGYILGLSPFDKNVPEQWLPYLPPLYKHLKVKNEKLLN